ncbi:hypothetical protein [Methylococcus geothermalis]|uniref:Uncharacterized protein n=1 Tax=Methylococcus geothermalis TaxID=2681310 RepID=A0A858Q9Z9_9GAMM|nr:hypothetical protein [Methylococcus geothermalis]QJD30653.1 hypothetical protein GNH96_12140 [Methylococcus geothermalis]
MRIRPLNFFFPLLQWSTLLFFFSSITFLGGPIMKVAFTRLTMIFALALPLTLAAVAPAAANTSLSDADKQLIRDTRQAVGDQTKADLAALKADLLAGRITKEQYKAQAKEIQAEQNSLLSKLDNRAKAADVARILKEIRDNPEGASDSANHSGGQWRNFIVGLLAFLYHHCGELQPPLFCVSRG